MYSMSETKRFFIALEVPEENKAQFEEVQQQLQSLIPQATLTDRGKLHLTLAFIGDHPGSLQPQLEAIISQAAQGISHFEVTPAYIDGFPNLHSAQVLWVGVRGYTDKILLIRERVKDGLKDLHLVTDERRFVPHITIAKVDNLRVSRDLEKELEEMMTHSFDPIKITSIKLFESIPEGGFHKHNTLAEVKLGQ